jgi:hypothetical protein
MKNGYESLSLATNDLAEQGYTVDFDVEDDKLIQKRGHKSWSTDEFEVIKFYRFEGPSNPSDNSILYVIEANDGSKGVLVMAYGSENNTYMDRKMVQKLDTNQRGKEKEK